jgi:hypothetical protein
MDLFAAGCIALCPNSIWLSHPGANSSALKQKVEKMTIFVSKKLPNAIPKAFFTLETRRARINCVFTVLRLTQICLPGQLTFLNHHQVASHAYLPCRTLPFFIRTTTLHTDCHHIMPTAASLSHARNRFSVDCILSRSLRPPLSRSLDSPAY